MQSDTLIAIFATMGVVCAVASVVIHIVFGILNIEAQDGSPRQLMLDNLNRYAGVGLIGAVALVIKHEVAIAAAVACIAVLVGGRMFTLALMSIVMRFKGGDTIIRALSNHERDLYLQKKAKQEKDDIDDKTPKGRGPKGPTTPTAPSSARQSRSKTINEFQARMATLETQVFKDLESRLQHYNHYSLQEYVEILSNGKRVVHDGAIIDEKDGVVCAIEIKPYSRSVEYLFSSPGYRLALQERYPVLYILITSVQDKERTLQVSERARKLQGIKGVIVYLSIDSSVELIDSQNFYKVLDK